MLGYLVVFLLLLLFVFFIFLMYSPALVDVQGDIEDALGWSSPLV